MADVMEGSAAWARTCWAVDTSGDDVIAVSAVRRGRSIQWRRLSAAELTAAADRRDAQVPCVACLHERASQTRRLRAPLGSVVKARKVLPSLLDIELPFPLEECVYDFLDVSPVGEQEVGALAVTARKSDLTARIEGLAARGLDPVAVDQEGLALWTQALAEMPAADASSGARACAVVYAGHDRVALAVGEGGCFLGAHGARILDAGALERLVRSHLEEAGRVRWLWTGPQAESPEAAGVRAECVQKRRESASVVAEPETFLARALAARALLPGPLRCNLRSGEFMHPAERRAEARSSMRTAAVYLAAGILLCAVNVAFWQLAGWRQQSAERTVTDLARSVAPHARLLYGQEVAQAEREAKADAEKLAPFVRSFEPSMSTTLASILDEAQQDHVALESIALNAKSATLLGVADDWKMCEKLAARLRDLGFAVRLDRQEVVADDRVRFSIIPLAARRP